MDNTKHHQLFVEVVDAASFGTYTIEVEDDVDWRQGEEIVIASTDYDWEQAEILVVDSVNGKLNFKINNIGTLTLSIIVLCRKVCYTTWGAEL